MKGIKTAVKTDWKNYFHGNTREILFNANKMYHSEITSTGFKANTKYTFAYDAEWYNMTLPSGDIVTLGSQFNWVTIGFDGSSGTSGKVHYSATITTGSNINESSKGAFLIRYSTGISFADDSYLKITNLICSETDTEVPYIDSDELKSGGQ